MVTPNEAEVKEVTLAGQQVVGEIERLLGEGDLHLEWGINPPPQEVERVLDESSVYWGIGVSYPHDFIDYELEGGWEEEEEAEEDVAEDWELSYDWGFAPLPPIDDDVAEDWELSYDWGYEPLPIIEDEVREWFPDPIRWVQDRVQDTSTAVIQAIAAIIASIEQALALTAQYFAERLKDLLEIPGRVLFELARDFFFEPEEEKKP